MFTPCGDQPASLGAQFRTQNCSNQKTLRSGKCLSLLLATLLAHNPRSHISLFIFQKGGCKAWTFDKTQRSAKVAVNSAPVGAWKDSHSSVMAKSFKLFREKCQICTNNRICDQSCQKRGCRAFPSGCRAQQPWTSFAELWMPGSGSSERLLQPSALLLTNLPLRTFEPALLILLP